MYTLKIYRYYFIAKYKVSITFLEIWYHSVILKIILPLTCLIQLLLITANSAGTQEK